MQSLLITLNKLGVKLRLEGGELKVNAPQGVLNEELRSALRAHKDSIIQVLRTQDRVEQELPLLLADTANRNAVFPLTDLQHAYWLGRDSAMEMGNVATHLYLELDCAALDVLRLQQALDQMIARHDMLRAVVDRDGRQRILPEVPGYQIRIVDASSQNSLDAEQTALATRELLSHQVLKADQWPLFDIRVTSLPEQRLRLHVSLDLLILDAWSIFLFFKEWHQRYLSPDLPVAPFEISFREYVLAQQDLHEAPAAQHDKAYWLERIEHIPSAPELPLRSDLSARQSPRFSRREARLPRERWQKLRAKASGFGLTASGLLLSCYAEVLARWSSNPHFTLNVTVSHRLEMHPEVNSLLGDFTSLVMEEVDWRDRRCSFLERAQRQQKQFQTDLDHRGFSGVAVMREWAKKRGISLQAAMPVVFSSGLIWSGDEEPGDLEQFGKKVFSVSQTSQVWLDHHVMELNGDLAFIWDAADAVFEEGALDAMFAAYCEMIEGLADDDARWQQTDIVQLPAHMLKLRETVNQTADTLPEQRLHAGFVSYAQQHPEALAIIAADRQMSYAELLSESCAVANALLDAGVQKAMPVAICMRKGWEQIVGVFGVLLAGAAYLPVDADLPAKRQLELLDLGEAKHVLTQSGGASSACELHSGPWTVHEVLAQKQHTAFDARHALSLQAALDELAYVIFTSGTTGVPKGVMIDHRGAVNTILHINRMFDVGAQDRCLAVSSLSFDLSVYDIFGILAVGGALVIPDVSKGNDPIHWRDLIVMEGVTFWNSAPQLMRMLMDSFYADEQETAAIRHVLLSGDFIPLDLPEAIRQRYTQAKVTSLGGATEASIWSIYHPIDEVQKNWLSIPYGKPLPNQHIWVLDHAFRVCPDQVKGRIYIGGIGLAMGYWRDPAKTDERFVTHPHTGERLYDTGDMGRYAADGNVFILGRDDGQIKIRGHRIELGEIETVLRLHPAIKQAIVMATGPRENRQLVAYLEAIDNEQCELETTAIKDYLAERLPDYMVPRNIVMLEAIPVSANGKIDYKALPEVHESSERVAPRNAIEQLILDTWLRVIPGVDIGVTDNFFELGGDSVLATQLVRELNAVLPFEIEMHELFENLTVEALANLAHSRTDTNSSLNPASADIQNHDKLLEDIRLTVERFEQLRFSSAAIRESGNGEVEVFITGASGWVGSYVLAQLLSQPHIRVVALLRKSDVSDDIGAKQVLLAQLTRHGVNLPSSRHSRLQVVLGDITQDDLGLDANTWRQISHNSQAIFHLAASKNVLQDYTSLSQSNVRPLYDVVRLAQETRLKPVFFTSPMTVCRRNIDGQVVVFPEEAGQNEPTGLLTGYAQSKWVGEQILLAATERGLPMRIYRTSHALPAASNQAQQANDTYSTVLKAACSAAVIPVWDTSALHGVPVDVFAELLVEDALAFIGAEHAPIHNQAGDDDVDVRQQTIVHIENRHPMSITSLMETLLADCNAPRVSQQEWKDRCLSISADLQDDEASLVKVLFAARQQGAAVDTMFSQHTLHTSYFGAHGEVSKLDDLTPVAYWRAVAHKAKWHAGA